MGQLTSSPATTRQPRPSGDSTTPLSGWRLRLVRLVWGVLTLLILSVFVFNLVLSVHAWQTRCTGAACLAGQLSPAVAQSLKQSLGLSLDSYATWTLVLTVLPALVWLLVAAFLVWRKGNDWFILLAALQNIVQGAGHPQSALHASHPFWLGAARLNDWLYMALLLFVLALFPDGRWVPGWLRWVVLAASVLLVTPWGMVVFPICIALGLGAQLYRYWQVSGAVQRQQVKWVLFTSVLAFLWQALAHLVAALSQPGTLAQVAIQELTPLVFVLIPLSLGISLLRYRLWDIDLIINRTLVYGLLTGSVVGVYILVVGTLGALLRTSNNLLISLLATGLIAVLFQPVRGWLQRGVNRLFYGQRDDPYRVISRLSQQLEGTLASEAVLPVVVETVAQALKLPYAAILVQEEDQFTTAASYGVPSGDVLKLPLSFQGETLGQLLLAPRAPGEAWTPADQRFLEELARQAGAAAHAVRLTAALQRSNTYLQAARERLVTAREEERRRLRRDLHDELGPTLAALTLKVGAARKLLWRDQTSAEALLLELTQDLTTTIQEIRRLVYNLRPPALDDLGLLGAIRERASQYAKRNGSDLAQGLDLLIEAPERLPPFPAAVEVAAYRIVEEALTNVARHAQAQTCRIRLALEEGLRVEVSDDGVGFPAEHRTGVGLLSMRERAVELGGRCLVEAGATAGTRVSVWLPLPREEGIDVH